MTKSDRIITFTNLFPSGAFPTHGLFVRERMRRVVALTGFDWVVVCPVPRAPVGLRRGDYAAFAAMPEREQVDGVEVWHPPYPHLPGFSTRAHARRIAAASWSVVQRLAAGRRAVLDAHYVYPDGVAAQAIGTRLGLRTVVTARGTDVIVLPHKRGVARQIAAAAPAMFARLAVSESLRRRFAEVAAMPLDSVQLARNGVDLLRFAPGDRAAARAALGLPPDGPLLLGVGRLVVAKGFGVAIEALRALPQARLVLIGSGPLRTRLAAAAPPDRVLFLGPQPPDRVALAYRACDVLVLPSQREGWPNVVTEALASGMPVVATPVGSVPEMLDYPAAGSVVPATPAAFAVALARILRAPPDPAVIRAHAEQFSWEEPVALVAAILSEALR